MAHEILSRDILIPGGASFAFVGAVLWLLPRRNVGMFKLRDEYAATLRRAGEDDRARRIDSATSLMRRRFPIYASVLFSLGLAMIAAGAFTLQ
jgi:hypothetical protein